MPSGGVLAEGGVTTNLNWFVGINLSWSFDGAPLLDNNGVVLATAGGFSAGEESVQTDLLYAMLIFGMIVVGGLD